MGWIKRGQRGQSTVEYVAVLAVVAALVSALVLVNPGIAPSTASSVRTAVCLLFQSGDCGGPQVAGAPAGGGEDMPQDDLQSYLDAYGDEILPVEVAGPPPQDAPTNPADFALQFGQGFAAQLWDELIGIKDTLEWIWNSVFDDETRAANAALWAAFKADPLGFAWKILQGLWAPIQAELAAGRDGAAVGRTVAMILAAIFGGKGLTKLRQLNPDVDAFLRRMGPDAEDQIRRQVDCLANSFTAATPVLLADGTALPIAEIDVGDLVLAADPTTGLVGPRPVTDLIAGTGVKELVDVTVAGATITATAGHPFWLPDSQAWVDADDLASGDDLLTANGQQVTITAVAERTATLTVHNLTVDDLHTYHVLAAATPLLVHNADADCAPSSPLVPGGGLLGHEAAGGHTVARHLDKTPQDLRDRLAASPGLPAASTFTDRAVAEAAVSNALSGSTDSITRWLQSGSNGYLEIDHVHSENVGIVLQRGATDPVPTSSLRVVLKKDPNSPLGYIILTSFPRVP